MSTTRYRAKVDYVGAATLSDTLAHLESFDLAIVAFKAVGEAGGNPELTVETVDRKRLIEFLSEHHDDGDEEWLGTLIKEIA